MSEPCWGIVDALAAVGVMTKEAAERNGMAMVQRAAEALEAQKNKR
jgi:hypothetical protein